MPASDYKELADRLYLRFKGVEEFKKEDAEELIIDSMITHGYNKNAKVPDKKQKLVILKAQFEAAYQIAYTAARYFSYTDAEEQVDKTQVAHNYRQLAKELQKEYEKERDSETGSRFTVMKRADRPSKSNSKRR